MNEPWREGKWDFLDIVLEPWNKEEPVVPHMAPNIACGEAMHYYLYYHGTVYYSVKHWLSRILLVLFCLWYLTVLNNIANRRRLHASTNDAWPLYRRHRILTGSRTLEGPLQAAARDLLVFLNVASYAVWKKGISCLQGDVWQTSGRAKVYDKKCHRSRKLKRKII